MASTEKDIDLLIAELKQLRSEFGKLGEILQDTARSAGEDAMRKASAARDRVMDEARDRADDFAQSVRKEPLLFTAGAFGIGILLGLLFGGRR